MNNLKTWYTIEKSYNGYTVWKYSESTYKDHGSYGSLGIYTTKYKKDCIKYCIDKGIKVKKV